MSPVARVECASTQQSLKSWRTSQSGHGAADYRDFNTFVLRHASAQFLHPLISHSHTQLDVLITIISDTNVPKRSSSSSSTSTKRKSPYSRFTHLYDNPSMLISHLNKYMTIATDLLPFTCFMLLLTVYSSWQTRSQDSSRSLSCFLYIARNCGVVRNILSTRWVFSVSKYSHSHYSPSRRINPSRRAATPPSLVLTWTLRRERVTYSVTSCRRKNSRVVDTLSIHVFILFFKENELQVEKSCGEMLFCCVPGC